MVGKFTLDNCYIENVGHVSSTPEGADVDVNVVDTIIKSSGSVFEVRERQRIDQVAQAIHALPAGENKTKMAHQLRAVLTDGRAAIVSEGVHKIGQSLGLW